MRLCHVLACGLSLPLFVVLSLAQSTGQTPAQQTAPAQPSAPATQSAPAAQQNVPSLQLHDLPAEPHTLTPEELAAQKAEQVRLQLGRIARAQFSWGPAISTAGLSLELKETNRAKTDAGTAITWQLTGKGFTPDMQLTLVRWPLNERIANIMSDVAVRADGTAVCGSAAPGPSAPADAAAAAAPQAPSCTKTMQPGTPISITSTAAKGEAIRVGLEAADGKHVAAVSYVPFPIESEDKGCKLNVILGTKDAEMVLIEGFGFKQDATYMLGSESFGEKHALTATIDQQGRFIAALTPWVPGHTAGDTVIYYQSSTCTPTVSFHWGKETYKPE